MTEHHQGGMIAAVYTSLADAEGALNDLLADGISYEQTHMGAHVGPDALRDSIGRALPERFWSIAVHTAEHPPEQIQSCLARHQPAAVGRLRAAELERSDPVRGAVAWGHYVFETPAATDEVTDATGTSGTTGVISSGAFADGANVQRNPPER